MAYRKTRARIEHSEKVRQQFLSAAADLCMEKGVQAVTVRKITALCQSSTGNFYFYFKDKDDLLRQMVQEEYTRTAERIDDSGIMGEGPVTLLVSVVYSGLNIALDKTSLLPLILTGPLRDTSREEYRNFFIDRTERFFKRHSGLTAGGDPRMAALFWQGAVQSLIEDFHFQEATGNKEQMIRECILWNCRALGLEERDVLCALDLVTEAKNAGKLQV